MGDFDTATLDRLLNVLEAQARSNGELAGEVRQQGERISTLAGEVRGLAQAVERSTAVATTLATHYQNQEAAEREDRAARRTLWVRAGSAAWGVVKSPLGMLLAGIVGWLVAAHLGVAGPTDSQGTSSTVEHRQDGP